MPLEAMRDDESIGTSVMREIEPICPGGHRALRATRRDEALSDA
jgi:hypothetical protein